MLKDISRAQVAGAWVAVVIVMMAGSVVAGANLTFTAGALWLVGAVVPPSIMLLVWKGAPPVGVAELLYSVNTSSKEGRP